MSQQVRGPRIVGSIPGRSLAPLPIIRLGPSNGATPSRETCVETKPCFASSWLRKEPGDESETISRYTIGGVDVAVASPRDSSYSVYTVGPPEYELNPIHTQALARAIEHIVANPPSDAGVTSLTTMRSFIKSKAKDFLYSYLDSAMAAKDTAAPVEQEAERLAEMLVKYTAGYGLIETLLEDANVQDIYVDAPSNETPVQVVLSSNLDGRVRQKCRTNMLIGQQDLQGFISRVKLETGLPFSEANPVLEADLRRLRARVTLVGPPISDKGVSLAIRKHATRAWTLPGLIKNHCMSPLLAGFLWCCVLGRRSILIAGSRGAGKTTLLGALLLEFPLSQRIILIEDTPEIPVARLQSLGFDVQALRFGRDERGRGTAEDALKVSLRMGESAIVIGEVRGGEAKVLYESMRAGSAGSSVLGTIHGNSASGVLDRAVEDLGVSERAFSSTDLIVVIGLIRSPDGARFERRVTEVVEVRPTSSSVALVPLFEAQTGCLCAMPTKEFTEDCKSIVSCASALGTSAESLMSILKSKSYSDQVLAENPDPELISDEFRVRSNERLTHALFESSGPESALNSWKKWVHDRKAL